MKKKKLIEIWVQDFDNLEEEPKPVNVPPEDTMSKKKKIFKKT